MISNECFEVVQSHALLRNYLVQYLHVVRSRPVPVDLQLAVSLTLGTSWSSFLLPVVFSLLLHVTSLPSRYFIHQYARIRLRERPRDPSSRNCNSSHILPRDTD